MFVIVDNVGVGDNIAVLRHDDAGADTSHTLRTVVALRAVAEETAVAVHGVIVAAIGRGESGLYADNRRCHFLYNICYRHGTVGGSQLNPALTGVALFGRTAVAGAAFCGRTVVACNDRTAVVRI